MKKEKGYLSLVAILVVMVIFLLGFFYLWNGNWFGDGIKVPSLSSQKEGVNSSAPTNVGDVNKQLENLQTDVKNLQNKKDQEILNELNE